MYGFDHEMTVFLIFKEGTKEEHENQNGVWEGRFQLSLRIHGVFCEGQIWKKNEMKLAHNSLVDYY